MHARFALGIGAVLLLAVAFGLAHGREDAAAAEGGGPLTGVVRLNGAPVEGATVTLVTWRSMQDFEELESRLRTTRTNAQGRYLFEGVDYLNSEVRVRHQRHLGEATRLFRISAKDVDLELVPPLVLAGRVVDEKDRPIRDAVVTLAAYFGGCITTENWRVKTDHTGAFRIEMVTPGTYEVRVEARGHETVYPESVDLDSPHEDVYSVVVLRRTVSVSGTLVFPDGTPAAGAWISVVNGASVTADPQGRFELDGLAPGQHSILARAPLAESINDVLTAPSSDARITLPAPAPAAPLEGQVVDADGAAVPGMAVRLHLHEGGGDRVARTDAEGRFHFEPVHHQAVQELYVQHEPGGFNAYGWMNHHRPVPLRIQVPRTATLPVLVLDSTGAPVEGASVEASTYWFTSKTRGSRSAATDAWGRAILDHIPMVQVSVTVHARGYERLRVTHLPDGQELRIRLERGDRPRLRGQVVAGHGAPISTFTINSEEVRHPGGEFDIEDAPHLKKLHVAAAGHLGRLVPLPRVRSGDVDLGRIGLRPEVPGRMRGEVVDRHGSPLAHVQVDVYTVEEDEPSLHLATASTDQYGRFDLPHVPAEVTLRTSHPFRAPTVLRVRPGEAPIRVVALRGGTLKVHTKDAAGEPFYPVVRLMSGGVQLYGDPRAEVTTFRNVAPGEALLLVEPTDGAPLAPRRIEIGDEEIIEWVVDRGPACDIPVKLVPPEGLSADGVVVEVRREDDDRRHRIEDDFGELNRLGQLLSLFGEPLRLERGHRYLVSWEHPDLRAPRTERWLDLREACPDELVLPIGGPAR